MTDSSDAPHDMNAATDVTTPASPRDTLGVLVRKVALASLISIGTVATAMMALAWTIDHVEDFLFLVSWGNDFLYLMSWGDHFWGAWASALLALPLMLGAMFIYADLEDQKANRSLMIGVAVVGSALLVGASVAMISIYDKLPAPNIYESVAFHATLVIADFCEIPFVAFGFIWFGNLHRKNVLND